MRDAGHDAHSGELGVDAANGAPIGLIDLIATRGVIEEVREVREQIQVVLHRECINGELALSLRSCPSHRQALTLRVAAEGGIDLSESSDRAGGHGARGNLVGGIPAVRVAQCQHGELVAGSRPGPTCQPAEFAQSLRLLPRAIVALGFAADKPPTAADRCPCAQHGTPETVGSCFE